MRAGFGRQTKAGPIMKDEAEGGMERDAGAMNLETILIMTGEMDHLAALLRKRAQDMKGVKAGEIVSDVIHPLLDELEAELRAKAPATTGKKELREIISAWIDGKMAEPPG